MENVGRGKGKNSWHWENTLKFLFFLKEKSNSEILEEQSILLILQSKKASFKAEWQKPAAADSVTPAKQNNKKPHQALIFSFPLTRAIC